MTSLLTKVALLPTFPFLFHSLTVLFFHLSHLWCSLWRVKVKVKRKRAFWGEEGLNVLLAPLGSKLCSHCTLNPIGAIGQSSEKKWAWPLLANWQLCLCVRVFTCTRKLRRPTLNYITHCITLHICLFEVTLCFTVLVLRCHMKGSVVLRSSEEWRNAILISPLSSSRTPSFLRCVENITYESEFWEWHWIASFIRRPAVVHTLSPELHWQTAAQSLLRRDTKYHGKWVCWCALTFMILASKEWAVHVCALCERGKKRVIG